MEVEYINAGIVGATAFACLYFLQRELEISIVNRTDPRIDMDVVRDNIKKLRQEGGLVANLAANLVENTFRGHKPRNTETLESLREYHDGFSRYLDGPEFLRRELTSFPTFRGIYRSLMLKLGGLYNTV